MARIGTPQTIIEAEGSVARDLGFARDDNPYRPGSPEELEWWRGWDEVAR